MSALTLPDRDAPPRLASYEDEREGYRPEVPDVYNPVIDIVEAWGDDAPEDLALVSLDGQGNVFADHTVASLAREARQEARALL